MRLRLGQIIPAGLLLGAILLVLPLPEWGRSFRSLTNLAHVPLGAGLVLVVQGALRRRSKTTRWRLSLLALAGTCGLLAVVEWLQPFVGRSAELDDLVAGSLGAAGALLLQGAASSAAPLRRTLLISAGVLALALPCVEPARVLLDAARQRTEMPLLASFENELELTRWSFDEADGSRQRRHATAGDFSLCLTLQPATYSGATLLWPPSDWEGYETLSFDLYLEGEDPLPLETKITDESHSGAYSDRFNRAFQLEPGPNAITILLKDVASAPETRTLDLTRIARLQLFTHKPAAPRVLYLDNVRLVGGR